MAILEEVPDEAIQAPESSLRSRKPKSKSPASGSSQAASPRSAADIPLAHPSSLPPATGQRPLLSELDDEAELYDSDDDAGGGSFPSPTPSEVDEAMRNGTLPNPMKMMHEHEHEEERERDGSDVVFDTLLYVIPFTSLFVMLDILVYMQYSFKPKTADLVAHAARALPTIALIIWYTNTYTKHWATNPALMAASLGAGARLIWLMNKASWGLVTAQAPAMGTLWTLTIVQLPLDRAVLCLILVGGWTWYSGLSLQPR